MYKQNFFLLIVFLLLPYFALSQGFQITSPKLNFDGNQLLISYDLIDRNAGDQFYVWVEIEKKNGEKIKIKALSGDIGDKINVGIGKRIIWIPAKDSVFLDENISVEVIAEKYVKSFNKGSMILLSAVLPGLGQTKISKGKPWWLTGVVTWGALAGGLIVHNNYLKTYDSYLKEEDSFKRSEFQNQAQGQLSLSNALIISGASLWAANIIWVALIPDKYQPLKYTKLSLNKLPGPDNGTTLLSLRINF